MMNRSRGFAGIGAAALGIVVLACGGMAYAVVAGQLPPDDSGPVASSRPIAGPTTSTPTATPNPSTTTPPLGSAPMAQRMRDKAAGDVLITPAMMAEWATLHPDPDGHPTATALATLVAERAYEAQCMWDLGYYWDPRVDPLHRKEAVAGGLQGIPERILRAYYGANFQNSGREYVWQNAGCQGAALHASGQDGTN